MRWQDPEGLGEHMQYRERIRLKREPPTKAGEVVEIGVLRKRRGVVLEQRGDELTVLGEAGAQTTKARSASALWCPGPRSCTPGRILAAAEALRLGQVEVPVAVEPLVGRAIFDASQSEQRSRLFAVDAIELGRPDLLTSLPLDSGERSLLWAWSVARRAQWDATTADYLRHGWSTMPRWAACVALAYWQIAPHARRELVASLRTVPEAAGLLHAFAFDEGEALDKSVIASAARAVLDAMSETRRGREAASALAATDEQVHPMPPPKWLSPVAAAAWALLVEPRTGESGDPLQDSAVTLLPASAQEDLWDAQRHWPCGLETALAETWCAIHGDDPLAGRIAAQQVGAHDLAAWWGFSAGDTSWLAEQVERIDERDRGPYQAALCRTRLADGDTSLTAKDLEALAPVERETARALLTSLEAGSWADHPDLAADRSLWPILSRLQPPPAGTRARNPFSAHQSLSRAKSALQEWRWDDALEEARGALAAADDEIVRDEALNLLAASQWQMGNPTAAIAALEKALQGAYTDSLLINAALVASELDPESSARHLGRLASEAPTAEQRCLAAQRSLALWKQSATEAEIDEPQLPHGLRIALRSLVGDDAVPDDAWRGFMGLLSVHDGHWLASAPASSFGSRGGSAVVKITQGRATSTDAWMRSMAAALQDHALDPETTGWVEEQRDGIVDAAIHAMLDEGPTRLVGATLSLSALEHGLPVDPERAVLLKALSTWVVAASLDDDGSEPADRVVDNLIDARRQVQVLDAEARDRAEPILIAAGDRVVVSFLRARGEAFSSVVDAYNGMLEQVRAMPIYAVNTSAVHDLCDECTRWCTDSIQDLDRIRPLTEDPDLLAGLRAFRENLTDAHRTASEMRRSA